MPVKYCGLIFVPHLVSEISRKWQNWEVFHIPSELHQSSGKLGPKANANGPIQKSADSADGQLQGAKLKSILHTKCGTSIKMQIST